MMLFSSSFVVAAALFFSNLYALESTDSVININPNNGCFSTDSLKEYKLSVNKDAGSYDLASRIDSKECPILGIEVGEKDFSVIPGAVLPSDKDVVKYEQEDQEIKITKILSLDDRPYIWNFELDVKNLKTEPFQGDLKIELGTQSEHRDAGGFFSSHPLEHQEFLSYSEEDGLKRESLPFQKSPSKLMMVSKIFENLKWAGRADQYFTFFILPIDQGPWKVELLRTGYNIGFSQTAPERTVYRGHLIKNLQLMPEQTQKLKFQIYGGPKVRHLLDPFPHATQIIDYGFFEIIATPIFYFLKFIYNILGNWGAAIIALTFLLKILFYPLQLRAYLAAQKLKKVQPKIDELKVKYADDKVKQQQEIMAVMSQNGANPMSGCLPLLPTIPVFFGLNAVVQNTFELRHSPFIFWIQDLSDKDPYYIMPLIMAALMYLQQRIMPAPSGDPAQVQAMKFIPLIFGFFMISSPVGLILYIMTQTILSILQQKYMNYRHP
jgi:YidC/Oxa1 family membrane protein insertase